MKRIKQLFLAFWADAQTKCGWKVNFQSFCKLQNLLQIHATVKFWKRQKRMSKLFNAQKHLTNHQSLLYFKYLQGKHSQKKMTMMRKSTLGSFPVFLSAHYTTIIQYYQIVISQRKCYGYQINHFIFIITSFNTALTFKIWS